MFAELTEDEVSKWIMNEYDNASSSRDTILQHCVYSQSTQCIHHGNSKLSRQDKQTTDRYEKQS